jgi:2-methylcitrate dehydratase
VLVKEKKDYEGFQTRPVGWETVHQKFDNLSSPYADPSLRREIAEAVPRLEEIQVTDLVRMLANIRVPSAPGRGSRG